MNARVRNAAAAVAFFGSLFAVARSGDDPAPSSGEVGRAEPPSVASGVDASRSNDEAAGSAPTPWTTGHAPPFAPGQAIVSSGAAPAPAIALAPGDEIDGVPFLVGKKAMAERAREEARFYLEAASIPPNNRVLPAGRDPLLEAAKPSRVKELIADGSALEIELSSWSALASESIGIRAHLVGPGGANAEIASASAKLLDTARTGWLESVELHKTNDASTFAAQWSVPPASLVSLDPGVHALVIEVKTSTGRTLSGQTSIALGTSAVRATGRCREALVDGSLSLGVEVIATAKVRVHVAATLAVDGVVDGPHVLAQRAVQVEPGKTWVDLSFHGRTMRALKSSGPYRVVAVQVHDTSRMPPARLPLERPSFVTAAHSLESFRNDPFAEPGLLAMARFLEPR